MKIERNGLGGPSGLTGFIQNQGDKTVQCLGGIQECKGRGQHN